jgi:hypothetical protein
MTEVNAMRILAIVSGEYGQRHVANVQAHAPAGWTLETWQAPAVLPPVLDYPEDYVPDALPPAAADPGLWRASRRGGTAARHRAHDRRPGP